MRSKGNYRRCGGRRERRQPEWAKEEGRRWRLARGRAGMKSLRRPPPRCRCKEGGRYGDVAIVVAAAAADRGEEAMARFCPAPLDSWTASNYILRSNDRQEKSWAELWSAIEAEKALFTHGLAVDSSLFLSSSFDTDRSIGSVCWMGKRIMEWAGRAEHLGGIPRALVFLAVGAFAKTVTSCLNSTSVHNPQALLHLVKCRPPGVPLLTFSNHMST
ncbi:hypothetical protein GW17_00011399 [Ensete ventricosum]|nr:hypothetical protein GW17_00011399 [Ensete ventricosum]